MQETSMCAKCNRFRPESRMSKHKAYGFEFYVCMSKATCKQYQKDNKKAESAKTDNK